MNQSGQLPDVRARVAANLKRLRTTRGLSQERLAELADLSSSYGIALEQPARTSNNPTLATLCRIADALGVDVAQLLDRSAGRSPADRAPSMPALAANKRRRRARGDAQS